MTVDELEYLEKVKIPEYAGYGWINPCNDMRLLIAEIRKLRGLASERSEEAKPA
jgi:hypothetical protein